MMPRKSASAGAISQLQRSIVNLQQHTGCAQTHSSNSAKICPLEIVHRLPDVYACFVGGEASAGFRGDIQRSPFKVRRRAEHLYKEVAARAFLLAYGQMPPTFRGNFYRPFPEAAEIRLERIEPRRISPISTLNSMAPFRGAATWGALSV